MTWEAWFTLGTLALVLVGLVRNLAPPDALLMGGLTLLMTAGLFASDGALPTPGELVAGFGNQGLITIAALYVVVAGMARTGAVALFSHRVLGRPRGTAIAQLRLMLPVAALSAFINNTPIVAMFLPVVSDWCKKTGISPTKLFLPLSYAAILGGTCTLIGTSTNLIVNGLLLETPGTTGLGLFELAWVGLPCATLGLVYLLTVGRWLLPDRRRGSALHEDPRQYTVEMVVQGDSALVGQSIEDAGLRHLPGLFLVEIEREGRVIHAVGPGERLQADDRLVFVGIVESVVDLRKVRGLVPATKQVFKLDAPRTYRTLIEAVVSDTCPLVGKTIRAGRFRSIYNAAVIAVARAGERIQAKIGDIVLQPGDTLLLEAPPSFVDQQRNSRDFFLVSAIEGSQPPDHDRAWVALGVFALMIGLVTFAGVPILYGALLGAALMVLTRCCTVSAGRRAVDIQVLVVIGAALGFGRAIESTGLAGVVATQLVALGGTHPWLALVAVYFTTMVFTEMVTNNAAAALMFPVVHALAGALEVSFTPFAVTLMMAASASFSTPLGYQTNLMVYGPGGYKVVDYLRVGLPLNLLMMIVATALIPWIWPL